MECQRKDGNPKRKFATEVAALIYAENMTLIANKKIRKSNIKNVYQCTKCNFFHFGRPNKIIGVHKHREDILNHVQTMKNFTRHRTKKQSSLAKQHNRDNNFNDHI